MGRPKIIDVEELTEKATKYLDETEYPTIVNFCRINKISKSRFYDLVGENESLSDIAKEIQTAREDVLERQGLIGEYNPAMAKFALAQIGWSEKQDINQNLKADVKTSVNPENLTDDELRALIELQRKSGTRKA